MTPFGAILQRAVESTPGAIGGSFADSQGEMIDSFSTGDAHQWALLTAHYGVVMEQLRAAFGTWHFGGPEYFVAQHRAPDGRGLPPVGSGPEWGRGSIDVIVYVVEGGYFALLALNDAPFAIAIDRARRAAAELRKEMS